MKVLIACERSGIVRDAFIAKGHDAYSCDLVPSSRPGPHIIGDAVEVASPSVHNHLRMGGFRQWDLMIAHPPCTYLCNSGVRWLHTDESRWGKLAKAAKFFKALLKADIPRIVVENPIPHKYAVERIGRKYDQIIQPWQYGHGETKATCFWLKGVEKLESTDIVPGRENIIHLMPPSDDRGILRSMTYQGIADAMADQWGGGIHQGF